LAAVSSRDAAAGGGAPRDEDDAAALRPPGVCVGRACLLRGPDKQEEHRWNRAVQRCIASTPHPHTHRSVGFLVGARFRFLGLRRIRL
jgi:hypothetical protein